MTIIEDSPISLNDDSSMDAIRDLVVSGKEPEPKEPAKEPEAETPAGTGEVKEPEVQKPEADEEAEIKLTPQEQARLDKRIAREVEKQAHIDRQIAEAVSARKAKEAELAKLTGTGSDPAKTPQTEEDGEPVEPDFATFEGTGEEFAAAMKKFKTEYRTWAQSQTEKTVESKFQEKRAEEAAKARWDSAVAEHGDKWESSVQAVAAVAPESLQFAISALKNWSKVAVHLADNPAELKALADEFKAHPPGSPGHYAAAAELGRIQAQIMAPEKKEPAPQPKLVPAPLKKVTADPGDAETEFDPANADMAQVSSWMRKRKLV